LNQLFYHNVRSCFSKLGQSFWYCTDQSRDVEDANKAITCFYEALGLTTLTDSVRFQCLENLHSFGVRFERFPQNRPTSEAVEMAVDTHHELLRLAPSGSSKRSGYLNALAISLALLFELSESVDDLDELTSAFCSSSTCLSGKPIDRIHALVQYARFAHRTMDLIKASELYVQVFHILPQLGWITHSAITQLEQWGLDITSLTADAAACMFALSEAHDGQRQDYLALAVELLDQGRSMWWSHSFTCGQDVDDFRKQAARLAEDLDLIGHYFDADDKPNHYILVIDLLNQERSNWWSHTCRQDLNDLREHTSRLAEELDRVGQTLGAEGYPNYQEVVEEWEQLLCQIRQLPEFQNFLLPLPISKLRQVANSSPVITTNISSYRHDVLIMRPDDDLVTLTFPKRGSDWSAVFNSKCKKRLDVNLTHTLMHERCVRVVLF
jgi:hypothetical protein